MLHWQAIRCWLCLAATAIALVAMGNIALADDATPDSEQQLIARRAARLRELPTLPAAPPPSSAHPAKA